MEYIAQYLVANGYSGLNLAFTAGEWTCSVNGVAQECSGWPIAALLGGAFGVVMLILIALVVLVIVASWKVYKKAGQPGWTAIIPIYNIYILMKIVGMNPWWTIAFFIPYINVVVCVVAMYKLAKAFGHGVGFTLGLVLLTPIFYMILAFGQSVYRSPNPPQSYQPA